MRMQYWALLLVREHSSKYGKIIFSSVQPSSELAGIVKLSKALLKHLLNHP